MTWMKNFWQEEHGQDLVEYTLLMAAMALATGAVILPMRNEISGIWTDTNTLLSSARSTST